MENNDENFINNNNFTNIYDFVEQKIKAKDFKDKNELVMFMDELKHRNMELLDFQMQKLLNLYDDINGRDLSSLNLSSYKGASLEDKNFIVGNESDRVLVTNNSNSDLEQEFITNQNEATINNGTLANADQSFERMANNEKIEVQYVDLEDALEDKNITIDKLNVIRFFASCEYIEPEDFKVSLSDMVFYNSKTDELYEVRYNIDRSQYEIYKSGELVFDSGYKEEKDEKQVYTENVEKKNKPLVRKLIKDEKNNHAFVTNGGLIINILILFFMLAMIFLLIK